MAIRSLPSRVLLVVLWATSATIAYFKTNEPIRVHLVPHSHDDVGWLKTVDQYYYGANNSIQRAGVQYILDTAVQELQKNPNRTFIYVEMAFFTRWWNEQNMETQSIVRDLVLKTKQLEFINAGWCMNDEASTHYNGIIDQMTIGLDFVRETFGDEARPRVAWQIDPFGHSSEQAALFAKMGYDGVFFARIDYDDKTKRSNDTTLEMIWSPSPSLGEEAEIFTGVLFHHYSPPSGFCWDMLCSDPPIQDNQNLFDYNVDERVNAFVKVAEEQAKHYATNDIMFTMGDDFHYENALEWYKNLDKLIHYVNHAAKGIEVFYSTPSRYIDAVHATNRTWTVKTDDFFPYADHPYAYWTGYFTSRASLKGYTRKTNSLLQSCKQLEGMGGHSPRASSLTLQYAMALEQHHDAVTGTEKQHVADDYAKRLHMGQVQCQQLISDVIVSYASSKTGTTLPDFQFCEYLNISICPASETDSFNVVIYNPIGRTVPRFFLFPVHSKHLSVMDDNGKTVDSQIISVPNAVKTVRGDKGCAPYEILFGDTLPPLGGRTYFVRPAKEAATMAKLSLEHEPKKEQQIAIIENDAMALIFNCCTGRLMSMENKLSNIKAFVDQQFLWWNGSSGNNINSSQASGAYIFRPNGTNPFMVNNGNTATISVVKGPLIQEVRQEFTPWLSQIIRLYSGRPVAEFSWMVGPTPFEDGLGREIVSRFTTDLDNDGIWYTDSNGREMQKRVRNFRQTWAYNNTEPVAGNYYPVNSRIYIRDEDREVQFTVLTDRSQGGSSLNDGQLELMVHRRLLHDDGRGVGEALNETGQGLIVRGRHLVLLDHFQNSTVLHRTLGELLMLEPVLAFLPTNESYDDYVQKYYTNYAGLTEDLPYNVHLLTLQSLGDSGGNVLLRLEHQFEINEAPYNNTVSVTLDGLFFPYKVTEAIELTLGGNAELSKVQRLQWNTMNAGQSHSFHNSKPVEGPSFIVELRPMEIRTFNITVEFNSC